MKKIKVGIIGVGYIGVSHIEAVRRLGFLELVGIADTNAEMAKARMEDFDIAKCYANMEELINDPEIEAVHNCTPTNLHLTVNEMAIKAGKHIFSEKPLAMNSEQSAKMLKLLDDNPDVVAGINFCYRMNPLMQDSKNRIANGEIGKPYLVHGNYLQDWLLFDTDFNWRVEPEFTGVSRCVGDIGSHWMDLAQNLIGSRISEVCANTVTALPKRKKPTSQVETFSVNTNVEYEEVDVVTEDYASVMMKFENGANGVFCCSEISAGRKCYIDIEVDGAKASLHWNHERCDEMWKGNRNSNNEHIMRSPILVTPEAKQYTYMAAGHPEGWNDAFKNNVYAFYKYILDGKKRGRDKADFATFEDGHYLMQLTEAIITSGKERRWICMDEFTK